jgi:hypothetical protein
MKGCFYLQYAYVGAAVLEIKSGKNLVLLKDENFSMQWDSLEDFSKKFTGSQRTRPLPKGCVCTSKQRENSRSALPVAPVRAGH